MEVFYLPAADRGVLPAQGTVQPHASPKVPLGIPCSAWGVSTPRLSLASSLSGAWWPLAAVAGAAEERYRDSASVQLQRHLLLQRHSCPFYVSHGLCTARGRRQFNQQAVSGSGPEATALGEPCCAGGGEAATSGGWSSPFPANRKVPGGWSCVSQIVCLEAKGMGMFAFPGEGWGGRNAGSTLPAEAVNWERLSVEQLQGEQLRVPEQPPLFPGLLQRAIPAWSRCGVWKETQSRKQQPVTVLADEEGRANREKPCLT